MIFKFFLGKLTLLSLFSSFFIMSSFSTYEVSAQTKNIHKGDVTGLPLPRFVSVKSKKVNVRRGPNSTYQIDWVYTRAGIPLKVTAEFENWRRVQDFQGEGGWVHARLLSGKRYIIFLNDRSILKRKPNKNSPGIAIIGKGVIARFVSRIGDWCKISIDGHAGWVPSTSVWGG